MLRRRAPISSSRALASATRFRQLRFAVIGKDVPDNLAQRIARQDQFDTESERRAAEPVVFVRFVLSVPCRLGKERDLTVSLTVAVPTKVAEGPAVHGFSRPFTIEWERFKVLPGLSGSAGFPCFSFNKTWGLLSGAIRAMPNGNVGISDGTDISFSDGLVRYRPGRADG